MAFPRREVVGRDVQGKAVEAESETDAETLNLETLLRPILFLFVSEFLHELLEPRGGGLSDGLLCSTLHRGASIQAIVSDLVI